MPKYTVEESILVDADVERTRSVVGDFRQWEPWSPWLSAEPNCSLDYSEDGKSYSWDGKIIGSGKMELVREEPQTLSYRLTFLKPWKSEADVAFHFAEQDSKTKVTWTMHASLPFFMFFMVKMMKAWIASDYRRGLSKLKDYVEKGEVPSRNEFSGVGEGLVSDYVGIRDHCQVDELGAHMPSQYERLKQWLEKDGVQPSAAPMAIYHKFDIVSGSADYTAAIPVPKIPSDLPVDFTSGKLNAPRTFKVKHTGAYRHLGSAWSAAMMHQRSKVFRPAKGSDPFELYVNDPASTGEEALITEIHLPAR